MLNMKKIVTVLLVGFMLISASFASGQGEEGKKIIMKMGNDTVASHPENKYCLKLAELVNERTDGRIEIKVFHTGQLGKPTDRLQGLRDGSVDLTSNSIGMLASFEPVMGIFESPYLFEDTEHQYKVYSSSVGDEINALLEKHGFMVLSYLEVGARNITNSKLPITSPADLEGLKLRVPNTQSSIKALSTMGASASPMAFSELYMALQQKVVDGQENPVSNIYNAKFFEVQDYLSLTGHQRLEQTMIMSTKVWNSLSEKDQKIFIESANDAKEYAQKLFAQEESSLVQKLRDEGMNVNEVDIAPFVKKVAPLRAEYIAEYGDVAKRMFDQIDMLK